MTCSIELKRKCLSLRINLRKEYMQSTTDKTKRYFVWFSYDGTRYHGWQIQPNGGSVQEELQRCLSLLMREEVTVTGAGRTDAGVHARRMVAHFDTKKVVDCTQLCYRLNRVLPRDIAALKVEGVPDELHARFSATRRTYHYYFHTQRDPFALAYSCELHWDLNREMMERACDILMEYKDFGAFCKSHSDAKTTLCDLYEARFVDIDATHYYFRISANRFLRNMVRAIVGTLVDVGRGRLTLDDLRKVIEGKSRSDAGESMPGNALFLEDVDYGEIKG